MNKPINSNENINSNKLSPVNAANGSDIGIIGVITVNLRIVLPIPVRVPEDRAPLGLFAWRRGLDSRLGFVLGELGLLGEHV